MTSMMESDSKYVLVSYTHLLQDDIGYSSFCMSVPYKCSTKTSATTGLRRGPIATSSFS